MKSNIFDINRFGLLLRKKLIDGKSAMLYELLGLVAVLALLFGLVAASGMVSAQSQLVIFKIGIAVLGIVYADRAFNETKNRVKGMFYLSTPASHLEKFLSALLYTSLFFPIAFMLVFLAVDGLFYVVLNGTGLVHMQSILSIGSMDVLNSVRDLLLLQSVFMLGSIWFKKRSLLKSAIAIVGFYALIAIVFLLVLSPKFGSYNGLSMDVGMDQNEFINQILFNLFNWLLPVYFWVVAYFRLKEKEI